MELIRYNGNFVRCIEKIKSAGQRVATTREGILDRIEQGENSYYKHKGCWHPEGTARVNETNYWCMPEFAPTTKYPQETLEANKKNQYLSLTDKIKLGKKPASELIKEIAEADLTLPDYKKRILIPKKQETFSVGSEALGDVDIAVFLTRNPKIAEKYGKFLKEKCGINFVNFCQIPMNFDNVASGFWLHCLDSDFDSYFVGNYSNFYCEDGSLFGVAKREALRQKKIVGEADAKKLVHNPTLTEILTYSNPFVPEVAREEFERGLREKYR